MKRPLWSVQLPLIFGMILLGFVAATAFTEWRSAGIDASALEITDNTAPGMEHLLAARSELRHLQGLLREGLERPAGAVIPSPAMEASRGRLVKAVSDYLVMPILPGEQPFWADVLRARDVLDAAVARCVSASGREQRAEAEALLQGDVALAADALAGALTRAVEFHAVHTRALASHIRFLRASSLRVAVALDVACALMTLAGAVLLRRAMRAHDELSARNRQLVEERAAELEVFASRIAHDIRSPLGTVSLALPLLGGAAPEDKRAELAARAGRAVQRITRLVDGLLGFARAGARPEPGAHAEVAETIADLIPELQVAAASAGAELTVSTEPLVRVACSAGVLASVVSNLAGNALKYLGDGPVRRVAIRARHEGPVVHVEVEDTGPGLAPGTEERVFEPYVRGRAVTQAGIGLGLATVKRLVEGHGGRTGVRSVVGEGCTFWVELPRLLGEPEDAPPAPRRG